MTLTPFIESGALPDAVTLVKQYGPFLGLLILGMIVVIWHDRKSDSRLTERIRTLEEEINNVLLPLTKERIGSFLEMRFCAVGPDDRHRH